MKLRQYQVDAFASRVFEGNPAAVVPLASWLDDPILQAIAEENNFAETAFFVPSARGFHLRWFTPLTEVDLCGHATLATAHVLFEHLGHAGPTITFRHAVVISLCSGRESCWSWISPPVHQAPARRPRHC